MKKIFFFLLASQSFYSFAQNSSTPSIKSVLLEQLKTTHNKTEWFVPANTAVEGLTAEQAMWKDGSGNHSVGQLVNHLVFWNTRELAKFKGEKPGAFGGNNDETFGTLDKKNWDVLVKQLDDVLTQLEKVIQDMDESTLKTWYVDIADINTHNAYHIGQIIFVRKLQGSWNPEKGVK